MGSFLILWATIQQPSKPLEPLCNAIQEISEHNSFPLSFGTNWMKEWVCILFLDNINSTKSLHNLVSWCCLYHYILMFSSKAWHIFINNILMIFLPPRRQSAALSPIIVSLTLRRCRGMFWKAATVRQSSHTSKYEWFSSP